MPCCALIIAVLFPFSVPSLWLYLFLKSAESGKEISQAIITCEQVKYAAEQNLGYLVANYILQIASPSA